MLCLATTVSILSCIFRVMFYNFKTIFYLWEFCTLIQWNMFKCIPNFPSKSILMACLTLTGGKAPALSKAPFCQAWRLESHSLAIPVHRSQTIPGNSPLNSWGYNFFFLLWSLCHVSASLLHYSLILSWVCPSRQRIVNVKIQSMAVQDYQKHESDSRCLT